MKKRRVVRLQVKPVPRDQLSPVVRRVLDPPRRYDNPPTIFVDPAPVRVLTFGG